MLSCTLIASYIVHCISVLITKLCFEFQSNRREMMASAWVDPFCEKMGQFVGIFFKTTAKWVDGQRDCALDGELMKKFVNLRDI